MGEEKTPLIERFKKHVMAEMKHYERLAEREGDPATRHFLEEILLQEEEYAHELENLFAKE